MEEGKKLKRSIYYTLSFVGLIWMVKLVENTYHMDFGHFGILPRTLSGTVGIITAPLIHGNIYHLLSNSFPLLILGVTFFYFYDKIAIMVLILIYLMTGFWVWIAARPEYYHIGASGIVYGLLSFLLCSGFLRRDRKTLSISFIMLFLYGGTFFLGMFPGDQHISWESHLMGAIAGVFCAIYFRKVKMTEDESIEVEVDIKQEETGFNYSYTLSKKQEAKSKIFIITYPPPTDSQHK